jgi:hypothetical protein
VVGKAETLVQTCQETATIAAEAVTWFGSNPELVGKESKSLNRRFRKSAITARKLEQAVHRPMCVGVFGPSQAGKSYLISALARAGDKPLLAKFDGLDDGVDFLQQINPEGGQESTGIVTRFTIRPIATPDGYPVAIRLLSQTDIIKIIGNTYFSDFDLSEEQALSHEAVQEILQDLSAAAAPAPLDSLSEDDVFDLQDYFLAYFKGEEAVKNLGVFYWETAAQIASRLDVEQRARLFSPLWGQVDKLTELYETLYNSLKALDFATVAYCTMDALSPRETSIVDVRTLSGLGRGDDLLQVLPEQGTAVPVARAAVTALIAELQIVIQHTPWPFFEHTDLLDFPGARSREELQDVEGYLEQPGALQAIFLRGKVAYLFDRYCADQELTSLLLCIGPSTQEVRTLPKMIREWVYSTHGADPETRAKNETALFLILTKFDAEFEDKAGQAESSDARWRARLQNTITDFLGKASSWPDEWHPGQPFDNSFLIRNPNFRAKHLFDYDADGIEVGLRPSEGPRVAQFREEYLGNDLVAKHIKDPGQVWDEALKLGDGGVSYLAERLEPVCNPEIKLRQIETRVLDERGQMRARLEPFFVEGDMAEQKAQRLEAAKNVLRSVAVCAEKQTFGELLRFLQLETNDLIEIFRDVSSLSDGTEEAAASVGKAPKAESLLSSLFGADGAPAGDGAGADPETPSRPRDLAGRYADAVMETWLSDAGALSDNDDVAGYFTFPQKSATDLLAEVSAGARRLDLEGEIVRRVRDALSYRKASDQVSSTPAVLAGNVINEYVNYFGFERVPAAERPRSPVDDAPIFLTSEQSGDTLQLPDSPEEVQRKLYVDWMTAFLALVEENASSQDGQTIDVEQNARVGRLVTGLR